MEKKTDKSKISLLLKDNEELRGHITELQEKANELEQLNSQLVYIIDSLPDPTLTLSR